MSFSFNVLAKLAMVGRGSGGSLQQNKRNFISLRKCIVKKFMKLNIPVPVWMEEGGC